MTSVLIVSPDPQVRSLARQALANEGRAVVEASDPNTALRAVINSPLSACIIDTAATADLRSLYQQILDIAPAAPILFLASADHRWLPGLLPSQVGRDEVLERPVSVAALRRAIDGLLARQGTITQKTLPVADADLDTATQELRGKGKTILLTPTEFRLLEYLARRPGQLASFGELLVEVWGFAPGTGSSELVRSHMRNLRAKLRECSDRPDDAIRTVSRRGYRLG